VRGGRIFSGLIVVSYVLVPAADGEGFACVRGSHKSEFELPADVKDLSDRSLITVPEAEPGDAIIFTEALTHGSTPWTSSHMRRALLFKYTPGHMNWMHPRWSLELLELCTPEQKQYLEPPYVADQPQFFGGDQPDERKVRSRAY
jgi:ectoine hydroxylase-related dioxygenase (phytanoyl-CoA dioxygenase family)